MRKTAKRLSPGSLAPVLLIPASVPALQQRLLSRGYEPTAIPVLTQRRVAGRSGLHVGDAMPQTPAERLTCFGRVRPVLSASPALASCPGRIGAQPFHTEKERRRKPIMMDWQSRDDDRNADPDWQADWHCGREIGLLIAVGLALVMVIVNVLLGGWETPVVAEVYPGHFGNT